jgi:hypothetical protein
MLVHLKVMMRWSSTGRNVLLPGVAAWLLACGGAEGVDTLFQPAQAPGEVKDVPPEMRTEPLVTEPLVTVPPVMELPTGVEQTPLTNETTPTGMLTPLPPPGQSTGTGCKPANGVSGSPTTISEAIVLLNTLPKPTTLACFLEALDRPLTLYMTSSDQSLQPSPGPRSPRTFVLRGDFEMSIVFEGAASNTLEFGYRPIPSRSIKAEIVFPLTKDVSEDTLFSRIQVTPRTTLCGACHVGEGKEEFPGFPAGVFASDVNEPYGYFEVKLDLLKDEATDCDKAAEPYRCGLLSALFEHGETVQGLLRGKQ